MSTISSAVKKSVIGLFFVTFFTIPLHCMEMEEKIQTKSMKNLSIDAKDLKKKLKEKTISQISSRVLDGIYVKPEELLQYPTDLLQYFIKQGDVYLDDNKTNKYIFRYLVRRKLLNARIYKKNNEGQTLYTPLQLCLLIEHVELAHNLISWGAKISAICDQKKFLKLAIIDRLDLSEGDVLINLLINQKQKLINKKAKALKEIDKKSKCINILKMLNRADRLPINLN